jgi:hypothetical protein
MNQNTEPEGRKLFRLQRKPFDPGMDVFLRIKREGGASRVMALPAVTWTEYSRAEAAKYHAAQDAAAPLLSLEQEEAQQLMDELWHCGLRPSEGSGSAGCLAATQRHLEDMRTLVFAGAAQPKTATGESQLRRILTDER